MLELDHSWSATGSSGGLTPVHCQAGAQEVALYCQASTLASTQSFAWQTALSSGGPWFTEGSTVIAATATASAAAAMRFTGPFVWGRPYLNSASTGTYAFRLLVKG